MLEYVIKRDGSKEKFNPEKLNKWAEYATQVGGNWSEIAQQTFKRLQDNCKTTDIHDTMVAVCLDKKSLEYSRVASRLEYAEIRKGMQQQLNFDDRVDFKTIYKAFLDQGIWSKDELPAYSNNLEDIYSEVTKVHLDFWQVKQWIEKYSIKRNGVAIETPHLGYMGIALALFGDTQEAKEYALALVNGKINLPTPALNGLRNGDWDTISCCVISAGDNTDSLGTAHYIAYRMTAKKAGIGFEYTTRSKGDSVKGGRVEHLGKWPLLKTLDREVKCLTQITRGGNATVTMLCIDPEIENALLWKSQRVDIEQRIDKLDYEFGYNDAFLQAVIKNESWYLFSLADAPVLYELFYTAHAEEYNLEVTRLLASGAKHKKVQARDILTSFLTVRQETGRYYDNNLTRTNQHTPFIDVIRQSNLCVAPETLVLTERGNIEISKLAGTTVGVWNGSEWSDVNVVKTGENQTLLTVSTDSGYTLDCTPYHRFYIFTGYGKPYKKVQAHELKVGDKLCKFSLPVVEGSLELDRAYINGFYSGDGCLTEQGQRVYLYGEKQNLAPLFGDTCKWSVYEAGNRKHTHFKGLKDKFFVPDSTYTVSSRLSWLAGYLDADGCIYRCGDSEQITMCSINPRFLRDIQMMLQTTGVMSKVVKATDEGMYKLPSNDGTGGSALFNCKASERLLINCNDTLLLQQLGLKLNRLKLTEQTPQRDARRFVKVTGVTDHGRKDDTYCFTEPKRNMGMFNGILTGQCEEIALPTKPYTSMQDLFEDKSNGETAFCSLSAINARKTEHSEYEQVAYLTLKAVDKMINRAPMLAPSMKESIKRRRSVGIGITGLASYLYNQGMDYNDDPATLNTVQTLSELHYFYLLKASQRLSSESGISVQGIKKDWLPIDTAVNPSVTDLDWESLRGKPRKHSVLVAHMPTESSSLLSGSSNGLYPVRKKIINKRSRKGLVQFICTDFNDGVNKTAWECDNITLSKIYGRIQDFTDQAISCDFYVQPGASGGKLSMSQMMKEWVAHAKLGNKTKYYLNTDDFNGGNFQDQKSVDEEQEEDGCESCKL